MCCFLPVGLAQSNHKTDSLRFELLKAANDTTSVKLLFELGNQFLNGPSDSLIYYYKDALNRIDELIREENSKTRINEAYSIKLRSLRFRALIEIGIEHLFMGKYETSIEYYENALDIATVLKDENLVSEVHGALGIVYKNQGEYALALEHYEMALSSAIALKDTSWIAACYANAGNVYRRLTNYEKALDYYLKAQEVFEQRGETSRIAIGNMNIGNLYEDQKDFDKALEYYSRALRLSYQTNDKKRISECLMNVGNVYANKNEYTIAREYYNKSLKINEELGYLPSHDNCYQHIGATWEAEGKLDKALKFYRQSYELAKKEKDKITLALTLGNLSNINYQKGNYEKAREQAQESLEISLETGDLHNISGAYKCLSNAYERLNEPGLALQYMKMHVSTRDSIFNIEKYKAITDMEMKYETEKKEQQFILASEKNQVEILRMSRRNRLVLGLSILVILILIIGYLLIRQRELKARHQSVELEQRLLRSQMNPHFIFNSLIAIQSFIYKKDPVQAGDYLAKFADLVRKILDNSRQEFISLENEVNTLQIYLELQALRFEHKFNFNIEVDKTLNIETTFIPPMLAQPFIENAIEHGLRLKQDQGELAIRFERSDQKIMLSVEDNGIGREKAAEFSKYSAHKSLAMKIINDRITVLSKKFKDTYILEINDLYNEKGQATGTAICLQIPYLLK